ncbi:MAG: hypothetical protein A2Z50_03820 [Nitrospirae bacterium RBG_19FT_COMBO_42_15]|nr:MAG: hypothetical protein A2Z50_03820 [Nitrospirae bacterium RBG_19FT_COMBO_42_15]
MKAEIIKHEKITDELGNTIEIKIWRLPEPTEDKPHGYKYSLVYIIEDNRAIGYDNAEGKGDHKHVREKTEHYNFLSLRKLAEDFYSDIEKYKEGKL